MQKAEENLDSGLREILADSGAEEFAPILAMRGITSKQIVYMKDKDLAEVRNPETDIFKISSSNFVFHVLIEIDITKVNVESPVFVLPNITNLTLHP